MNTIIATVALLLFGIMLYFDVKNKEVPSMLGTATIFVLAFVNIVNLPYAFITFVFALFLYESGLYSGYADVKMISAIGFLLGSLYGVYAFVIMLTIITLCYNLFMRLGLKIEGEYAGTVPIFITYVMVWIAGGLV